MGDFFPTNDLSRWAKNGFLLLNTILTVEEGKAGSHKGMGWEDLIDEVILKLNDHPRRLVFLLWGNEAKSFAPKINNRHMILQSAHPASEAYGKGGFRGCKHFSILRDSLQIFDNKYFPCVDLKHFLNISDCEKFISSRYPEQKDELIDYLKNYLQVYIPLVRSEFYDNLKMFEINLSTNLNYVNYGKNSRKSEG